MKVKSVNVYRLVPVSERKCSSKDDKTFLEQSKNSGLLYLVYNSLTVTKELSCHFCLEVLTISSFRVVNLVFCVKLRVHDYVLYSTPTSTCAPTHVACMYSTVYVERTYVHTCTSN